MENIQESKIAKARAEEIKRCLKKYIKELQKLEEKKEPFFKERDKGWIPSIESFCMDEEAFYLKEILIWGSNKTKENTKDYSWITYDPSFSDRFQAAWRRGNLQKTCDIYLSTAEPVNYGYEIDSIIECCLWLDN